MPRDLRPLLLSATVLLALTPVPSLAAGDDTTHIGTATGVSFSGYTKDAEGRRLWSLSADKASPLTGPGSGKNDWTLERVRIRTFDKTARAAVTIAAPNARYRGDARAASDPGPVTAEGDGVKLTGVDWSWVNGDDKVDTISINSAIRVTVTPPGVTGEKAVPVVITAKRLVARVEQAGVMHLEFEGDVRLVRDSAVMTCDSLSTFVRGAGRKPWAAFGLSAKPGRDDVERIDARGHVRLVHSGMSITGRTGEIIPAKNLYSITGDAEFRDFSNNRVRVNGDAMHYEQQTKRIKVDPKADSPDGRVSAEFPCLDETRAKNLEQSDLRARVSGRDLEIRIAPQGNTILLTGDVRLIDPDYLGSCEKLAVETERKGGRSDDFIATETKGEAMKSMIAEGSVTLTRDGSTVRCGHAEILPKKNLAILTLSPRAEDPTHGASLEASRMTLDSTDRLAQKLTAESDPGSVVKVTLPSLKKSEATARKTGVGAGPTTVTSTRLVMTRRGDAGIFEFEDKVKIAGTGLAGSCERLGVEVETRAAGKGNPSERNIRRIVATGGVKLRQDAYAAEAARAEIFPNARIRELSVADDNGMDGKDPFFVSLSRDETISPGLRPKVTLPSLASPTLGMEVTTESQTPDTQSAAVPTTIESDYQELVHGSERLRAFARGDVRLAARGISGHSASAELIATAKPAKPGEKPKFTTDSLDTLVARGGVEVRFSERNAKAETLEVFPAKNRLVLSGHPFIDGWSSLPGINRKTLDWVSETGPDGKPRTKLHIQDEVSAGLPVQIIRPRIMLPAESTPDLGRALKSLDKAE